MVQFNYTPTSGKIGSRATLDPVVSVSGVYAGRGQTNTLTFAGTATDGAYTAVFSDLDVPNITVSIVRATTPATNTDLATAWAALANADTDLRSMFLITSAAGVVTITARENGNPFTLTVTAVTGPATLVSAVTVTSAPVDLPMGVAVIHTNAGRKQISQPTAASVAFDIVGVAWDGDSKTDQSQIPTLGQSAPFVAAFPAGSMVPVMKCGVVYVAPEVDVSEGDTVWVRMTATGTEVFGAFSNVTDGGDNLQIQAVWEEDGTAGNPTAVRLNLPGGA